MQLGIPDYRTQRFTHQKGVEKVVKDNYQARDQNIFRDGEVSGNRGTSINVSCTKYKRRVPQGKILVFFSPRHS